MTQTSTFSRGFRSLVIVFFAVAIAAGIDYLLVKQARPLAKPSPLAVLPPVKGIGEAYTLAMQQPRNVDAQLTVADVMLKYGHFLTARNFYDRAREAGAPAAIVLTGRVRCFRGVERYDLAAKDVEVLIRQKPGQLDNYLTLSELQVLDDNAAGAVTTLDRIPISPNGLPKVDGQDSLTAAELMATAYSHADRWDKTEKLVRAVLADNPTRPSSRIMLGKVLHASGKLVEAIPYLEEGVKAAPKNTELHYLLGSALIKRGQPDDRKRALDVLASGLRANGRHGPSALALAQELEHQKMQAPASYFYNLAFRLGMEGSTPLLKSGDLLLKIGNIEEGWYRRGLYFEQTGRPELALAEYKKLTKKHDTCRSGFIHMARAYAHMHKPEKTLEYLQKARELGPVRAKQLDWSVIEALGEAHEDKKRLAMLIKIANEGGQDGIEASYQLAKLRDSSGQFAEAEMWIRKAIAAAPNDAVLRVELGRLALQQRADASRLSDGIKNLEEAIKIDPGLQEAWYSLGMGYRYSGRHEESVLALRHSIDLANDYGEGYQTLSLALRDAGMKKESDEVQEVFQRFQDFRKARETLEARVKRAPQDPAIQKKLGEFHMQAKEYTAAAARFENVLKVNPTDRQSRARLAEAYGLLGQRDQQRRVLAMVDTQPGVER